MARKIVVHISNEVVSFSEETDDASLEQIDLVNKADNLIQKMNQIQLLSMPLTNSQRDEAIKDCSIAIEKIIKMLKRVFLNL